MKTPLIAAAALLAADASEVRAEVTTPIVRLEGTVGAVATQDKYPPEMVVEGQETFDGAFVESLSFSSWDGKYFVRVWESGPGILQTDGYPYDEYCLVTEGQLEVTNKDGTKAAFVPGDSFVIPKGWQGKWDMKTRFRKQYIALIPASGGGGQ